MKFYLIVSKGKKRGFPIPIEIDLFLIGSGKMCQLQATHPDIGKHHCALVVRSNKVFIRDMGSGKATRVNGEIMSSREEWPLHKGDKIAVGPMEFAINFREGQLNQRDLEEWALKQLDEDTGPKVSALDELDAIRNAQIDEEQAASIAGAIISRMNAEKGVVRGRLRISREGLLTIVRINDVHLVDDAELGLLKRELHSNLAHSHLRVLLDFKTVRRMSAAAADMFAELVDWLKGFGSSLAMCRLTPELKKMMEELQSIHGFLIFEDRDHAKEHTWYRF